MNLQQSTFVVEAYFRSGVLNDGQWSYSAQACLEDFRIKFPEYPHDNHTLSQTIARIIHRFTNTGNVSKGKGAGKPPISQEVIDNIADRVNQSPTKSLRKLSTQANVPLSTCHKILRAKLHMHPYKLSVCQQLLERDFGSRLDYCHWFQATFDDRLLDITFYSDEAWFQLSGYVH